MGIAAKFSRKIIRIINGLVNIIVLTVILMLLVFSCYAVWDSGQIHSTASSRNYQVYKPTQEEETASFAELQALNPDVFAWITVYGTNIDYPVVQGQDNMRYVNTDVKGNHSVSGAIFMDYRCGANFTDFSSILYGHHMENQAMFGEIGQFSNKNYFEERKYGELYVDGLDRGLEFFAFLHADAYDFDIFHVNINDQEKQEYLDLLIDTAIHFREDVPVTTDDQIILLSTCSSDSTNGRDILVAKITDSTFENQFWEEEGEAFRLATSIDGVSGFWADAPMWMKAGVIAAPILLILLAIILTYKKGKGDKYS